MISLYSLVQIEGIRKRNKTIRLRYASCPVLVFTLIREPSVEFAEAEISAQAVTQNETLGWRPSRSRCESADDGRIRS
jgi:hypothetical protein